MRLSDWIVTDTDSEITSLCIDSRKAAPGCLFFCLRGAVADGHSFAGAAYEKGCRVFAAEEDLSLPGDARVILMKDTRLALAEAAAVFYNHPDRELCVVAVTGTKGKTTVAMMAKQLLDTCGIPAGYIGTCGISYGDVRLDTANTTPDSITLQKTMRDMVSNGIRVLCLEVSSQAVKTARIHTVSFAYAVMTNFSPDHIGPGEHETIDEYLACKKAVLTDYGAKTVLLNRDDPTVSTLGEGLGGSPLYYGSEENADFSAADLLPVETPNGPGTSFVLKAGRAAIPCTVPLPGEVNVSNALAALAVASLCGASVRDAAVALGSVRVPGRFETYTARGVTVVIDYAHNGASLTAALQTLRPYCRGRLICLFGSVGERTQIRRRELGEAAAAYADVCVVTADNPGNEPAAQINREIADAIGNARPVLLYDDREQAITETVLSAAPGDVILLAGKGHETYQLIGNGKIPFSEKEILKNIRFI